MTRRFLDTNILLRYLTRDDEEKAAKALELLQRVERGQERIITSVMVVFETIFTLQNSYRYQTEDKRADVGYLVAAEPQSPE